MDLTFDCSLAPKQALALTSKAKVIIPVGGRRFGKTEIGAKATIMHAVSTPKGHSWVVGPDYPMLRVAERRFFELVPRKLIGSLNKTTKELIWFNGHVTEFRSVSDPDKARGPGLTWCWADECALIERDAYLNIKAALSDKGGRMILTTTPRGFYSWLRDIVGEAEYNWALVGYGWEKIDEKKSGEIDLIRFTSFENGFVPHEEFHNLKKLYDEEFYRQEILGEFINRGQGLVFKVSREHNVAPVEYSKDEHLYIFQDFNLNPMTSVLAHVRHGANGTEELHIVGEVILEGNTIEHGQRLIQKGYAHGTIICDPAGRNRNQGDGKSNVDLLKQQGFTVHHRQRAIPKEESLNAVRAMLKNFKAQYRLKINPRTAPKTLEALEKLPYKKNSMDIDKSLGYDHCVDAVSYGCEWLFPVKKDVVRAW